MKNAFWKRAFPVALALTALLYVFWVVPMRGEGGLLAAASRVRVPWLLGLFAIYLLGTLCWAERWRALLVPANIQLSRGKAWRITLESQAGGVLLPGGIGGDALRIAHAQKAAPIGTPLSTTMASVVVDRVLGLFTMALVALSASLLTDVARLGSAVYAIVAILLLTLIGWRLFRSTWLAQRPIFRNGFLGRTLGPVLAYTSDPRGAPALARALLMSLLVSVVQLGVTRGLVLALGVTPTDEAWVYVGTTIAMIVAAVPGIPGGWGSADAAYVMLFARAGIPASAALAVCILYRAFWYLSACLGAVSALMRAKSTELTNLPHP